MDNSSTGVKPEKSQIDSAGTLPDFDIARQDSLAFDGRFLRPGVIVRHPNPKMPLLDAVCTRRTSRAYADRPVGAETFAWLVRHAMNAPTACNEQQWKIVHIDDPRLIRDLYERGTASFIVNARQCFLLCYNRVSDNGHWHDHVQSGAAFITTFQLLAHSIGIGSCWIGHMPNKSELARLLGIDRRYEPIALVSYGYYLDKVRFQPRKHDAEHIIMRNRFDAAGLTFKPKRGTLFRTVARYFYYKLPAVFRRRIRDRVKPFEKKFYYETFD